ncbi:alpha/beta fold hydrolase [Phytohabitans houttuyneae]|uniref:Alpha/beta hydrolase n=1 Tax=Phytohabitans houttuyneae TaxID=1076126 RepID=A0A6V8KDG8_9ACTN|nr:alpha/beta hydrolase [Phytohabitans houttuyneae]GFJ80461.1 alpha/beta hydrolase [Phytohabitans houttuyneae]
MALQEAHSEAEVDEAYVDLGGRTLAIDVTGDPDGYPIFLMHGTPGSKSGPKPRPIVLHRMGIKLISYDRPGYGGSDPLHERSVADAAKDVEAIADHLRIEKFAVVGRSGGGPHALACAAILHERVTSAAALVCFAPADAADLDWYEGMAEQNVSDYMRADNELCDLIQDIKKRAYDMQDDPESLVNFIRSSLCTLDERVVNDRALRKLIKGSYRVAVRQGPIGWIDDTYALRTPWGFRLGDIACPVLLWHGEKDRLAPRSHTLWLGKQILRARVWIEPEAGHFAAVEILPEVLASLTDPETLALTDAVDRVHARAQ